MIVGELWNSVEQRTVNRRASQVGALVCVSLVLVPNALLAEAPQETSATFSDGTSFDACSSGTHLEAANHEQQSSKGVGYPDVRILTSGDPGPIPSLHDVMSRASLFFTALCTDDPDETNSWFRSDEFTNASIDFKLEIVAIDDVILLDPEDLGFQDTEPDNIPQIVAAAQAQFPEFHLWGGNFWIDEDAPQAFWTHAENPFLPLPVTLNPGESFNMNTEAFSTLLGCPAAAENTGELVIGWRFEGNVIPTWGDSDGDGDVDEVDFVNFLLCFTHPGGTAEEGCETSDIDGDGDVDFADFRWFQIAFSSQ